MKLFFRGHAIFSGQAQLKELTQLPGFNRFTVLEMLFEITLVVLVITENAAGGAPDDASWDVLVVIRADSSISSGTAGQVTILVVHLGRD